MREQEFVVWEWVDVKGDPFYVGFAKWPEGQEHPATVIWKQRYTYDTELHRYLRELKKEPRRSKRFPPTIKMFRQAARQECYARRKQIKEEEGLRMYSTRPKDSWNGGGSRRVVQGPKGVKYPSVRQAAAAYGWNPCRVSRYCLDRVYGWKFVS